MLLNIAFYFVPNLLALVNFLSPYLIKKNQPCVFLENDAFCDSGFLKVVFKDVFRRKYLFLYIFLNNFHHHKVHSIVFDVMYNMVYFDKYKHDKIDFEKVAFFSPG